MNTTSALPVHLTSMHYIIICCSLTVLTAIYFLIERHSQRKKWELMERLRKNGALPFVTDALDLRRILKAIDLAAPAGMGKVIAAQHTREQIDTEDRRAVKGMVCGYEVLGFLKQGELRLSVSRPEVREAILQAFNLVVNRGSNLYLGLRLRLTFVE